MFKKKRFTLATFILLTMLLLGACTIGQTPEATPTALNVDAIYTSAAETARAQMTDIASLSTSTLPPTSTLAATATSEEPLVQVTLSIDFTPIASPDPLLVGTAPALPGALPSLTPISTLGAGDPGPTCNSLAFEGDITIPDGTQFKAWEKFEKVWKLRNTGVCPWDEGYSFRHVAGPTFAGDNYYITQKSQFIAPGDAVNMAIRMYAPGDPGKYESYWSMYGDDYNGNQPFGWWVAAVIEVIK
ncbi:MAG: NBR1-Ig-like domain-containing protein [Anaerolineales bacterium]|nr:NBR1-Ig-like domain-containing protein [Anaerolineales bacterium]